MTTSKRDTASISEVDMAARDHAPDTCAATEKEPLPLTPEGRALFLAAPHCQGGHSAAGDTIASLLGVPFPLRMTDLITKLREHGENPVLFYPWLRVQHGSGAHRFFTPDELAAAREHSSPPSSERSSPGRPQDKADQ